MKASPLAIAATLALSLGAHAQGTYPEKPVRIIVELRAGKRHRRLRAPDG